MNTQNIKHETHGQHPGNFLAGMLFGGLAGAAAILLLAPQSGKRTRTEIRLRGLELKERATDAIDAAAAQTRGTARQITADVREKAKEIRQSGQDLLAEQKARLSAAVAAGKTAFEGPPHAQV
jgi:gas vesicle protein